MLDKMEAYDAVPATEANESEVILEFFCEDIKGNEVGLKIENTKNGNLDDKNDKDSSDEPVADSNEQQPSSNLERINKGVVRIENIDHKGRPENIVFPIKDLIGCEFIDQEENIIEISILTVEVSKGWFGWGKSDSPPTTPGKRVLQTFELNAISPNNALNIIGAIQDLIVGNAPKEEYEALPKRRKILVFLNPFSNNGKSRGVWENHGKAIFDKASLDYEFIETERGGQASEYVNTQNLDEFD